MLKYKHKNTLTSKPDINYFWIIDTSIYNKVDYSEFPKKQISTKYSKSISVAVTMFCKQSSHSLTSELLRTVKVCTKQFSS